MRHGQPVQIHLRFPARRMLLGNEAQAIRPDSELWQTTTRIADRRDQTGCVQDTDTGN